MEDSQDKTADVDRWGLIRDAGVMQVKLIVDGFRDLLLVPASIIAAIIALASGKDGKPGTQFYDLLRLGKESEHAINLFGAYDRYASRTESTPPQRRAGIDDLVEKVETFVVDEYKRGGVTSQAKEQFDKLLDSLQGKKRDES